MRMYSARPGGRVFRPEADRLPVAMSGALALLAAAALALACLGELRPTWLALAAYTATSCGLGAFSRPRAALLIAGAAWLFHNGFAEHRHAELGRGGTGVESAHLALFTLGALMGALPGMLPRRRVRTGGRRLPQPSAARHP
ncbi:hypothetical protein KNE206_65680 [Kitasatospora sp. NE20-6]|uniref:hypothetical protein n=1 Tax=Kitasatospora sp. NE20-6 TaxID=2859066 RepID=UPI0034DC8003